MERSPTGYIQGVSKRRTQLRDYKSPSRDRPSVPPRNPAQSPSISQAARYLMTLGVLSINMNVCVQQATQKLKTGRRKALP